MPIPTRIAGFLLSIACLLLTARAQAQGSRPVGGVISAPTTSQTIMQPPGTTMLVSSLQGVLNEAAYPGSTVAARVNAAAAACGTAPCHVVIPPNESPGTGWTFPLPPSVVLDDQRYLNDAGTYGNGDLPNIRAGHVYSASFGSSLPWETGPNNGRFVMAIESNSYSGTAPSNGGGLIIFTTRTGGNRPIWGANFNTQFHNLNATTTGMEMDMVNQSGLDDTTDTSNLLQLLCSSGPGAPAAGKCGLAFQIGSGNQNWLDAAIIQNYTRTGITFFPVAGRNADIGFVPPADDTNLEILGRNHANTTNSWSIDDSGNLASKGAASFTRPSKISSTSFGQDPGMNANAIEWNLGGGGETDLVNNTGGSSTGGFIFWNAVGEVGGHGSRIGQLLPASSANMPGLSFNGGTNIVDSSHICQSNGSNCSQVITGPSVAPTGSCTTVGWVFSQDGHATFCNGSNWVTKI